MKSLTLQRFNFDHFHSLFFSILSRRSCLFFVSTNHSFPNTSRPCILSNRYSASEHALRSSSFETNSFSSFLWFEIGSLHFLSITSSEERDVCLKWYSPTTQWFMPPGLELEHFPKFWLITIVFFLSSMKGLFTLLFRMMFQLLLKLKSVAFS